MITTAEASHSTKKFHFDIHSRTSFPGQNAPSLPPERVPVETRTPMRPQPTPVLITPFRWYGWSLLRQAIAGLLRVTRLATGLKRD